MLLNFEGFDMHRLIATGLDVGGGSMQDAGYYYKGGTITKYQFVPGHGVGQAMRVSSGGINATLGGPHLPGYHGRVGFWAKMNPNFFNDIVRFKNPGESFEAIVSVLVGGMLRITVNGVVIGTSLGVVDEDWAYYEFHCNAQLGTYSLARNSAILVTGNGPIYNTGQALRLSWGFPSLNAGPDLRIDHVWVTDGNFPEGSGVLGVQVVAAADRYDGNNGFRGTVIMLGQRYQTAEITPDISSQAAYASGENLTNVLNYMFPLNPVDNNPWNSASASLIAQWGLCWGGTGTGQPEARVTSVCLAILDANGGQPIVRNIQAGAATSFSGPWRKSSGGSSFAGLVRALPRDNIQLEVNDSSLYIGGEGCILFENNPESPEDPILDTIGITFAEEFREDYKDWVRILGSGVSFDSMFSSGYSVLGEGDKKFQDNYVTVNYDNVPTGACYIQGLWDYAENSSTGRWSMRQSIDNKGGDYRHAHRRIKIRGHGKAMQLRVINKGNNPFIINGWSILVTGNTSA